MNARRAGHTLRTILFAGALSGGCLFAGALSGGCTGAIDATGGIGDDPTEPPAGEPVRPPSPPPPGAPSANAPPPAPPGPPPPAAGPAGSGGRPAVPLEARLWRLTRAEYDNTVRDLVGDRAGLAASFVQEPGGNGFDNAEPNLGISSEFMDQASKAAVKLAAETLADANRATTYLDACVASQADADACGRTVVERFGRRAFRRPLTMEERDRYFALYAKAKPALGGKMGLQLVVEAMLQSPHFLFRSELGDGKPDARGHVRLTPHEVATVLSYALTGSMPDAALQAAADSGALSAPDEVQRQARRLIDTPGARAKVWAFFRQMLDYGHLDGPSAKAGPFAKDFAAAKPSLEKETETFVRELLWNDDASFTKLLTANHTYVDAALAKLYGVPAPAGGKTEKVTLDAKDRAGLLTQAGLMAALSHDDQTSPVLRGVFVMERLLCREPPPPPPGIDANPPQVDGTTTRERYRVLTETVQPCQGCHKPLNAPGYVFEHLDWVGRVRREDNRMPVDTTADIVGTDFDGRVAHVGELAQRLAGSALARECLATHVFRFSTGRKEVDGDLGAIAAMTDAFGKAGWNVKELFVSALLGETALVRRAGN